MVDLYMDTLKVNPTDKWQKLKLNIYGNKLFLEFIIFIKEMLLIGILSWKIFC